MCAPALSRWAVLLSIVAATQAGSKASDPPAVGPSRATTNALPALSPPPPAPANAPPVPGSYPGEQYAKVTCTTCHVLPTPDLLPKSIWTNFVFKKMAFYTGIFQLDMEKNEESDLYKASGLFPSTPLLTQDAWNEIVRYYLATCPQGDTLPHGPRPEITLGLKQFEPEAPRFRRDPPLTTLTHIDPVEHRIYTSDATLQSLDLLSADGRLVESLPVGNIPVWMKKTDRGIYLACIGHFFPKEERRGQLIFLQKTPQGYERKVLLSSLPRPCHIEIADLNGDERPDILLSMFGYLTGRFSWLENLGNDEYREHIPFAKAGALTCAVQDFDGNRSPDIAVLLGQETDGLNLYLNNGKGEFVCREIFRKPPCYGHTYLEADDFNRDGRPDLLVCTGDNGDYESPAKPYHGIRLLLNQGKGEFKEACFLPMHGVFRAIARDFDGDGDLDIASIAFYPDYEKSPRESFVYWENLGDLKFKPYTFRECISGRWMTMDVGDLEGDGQLDIVLGSMIRMPSFVPAFLQETWEKQGPSVLILKNMRHSSRRPGGSGGSGNGGG